jgi:class I fructose-bisphosphate aldolase
MIGCLRRIARMFDPVSQRIVVLALDHGSSLGMVPGIERIPEILEGLLKRNVQGVVLNKGLARNMGASVPIETNIFIQVSAGTRHGLPDYNKAVICSVSEAMRLGADAISIHVNIGNDLEDRMLMDLGVVTDDAHQLGIPVMATIFPRGGQIVNGLDPSLIADCIRLGAELGPDLVCVPWSGDARSFSAAVKASPTPVLIAGGEIQANFDGYCETMAECMDAGAAGVVVGRNVFQDSDPLARLDRLLDVVHKD